MSDEWVGQEKNYIRIAKKKLGTFRQICSRSCRYHVIVKHLECVEKGHDFGFCNHSRVFIGWRRK